MAEVLTEPDVAAAEQLVQLSGGEEEEVEEAGEEYDNKGKRLQAVGLAREPDEIVVKGKREQEEEDGRAPRKRKRFLPLAYLYKVTKPITVCHQGNSLKPYATRTGLGS